MRLLRRCLRRDARPRLQHIGDARVELADLEADGNRGRRGPGARLQASDPRWPGARRRARRRHRRRGVLLPAGPPRSSPPRAPQSRAARTADARGRVLDALRDRAVRIAAGNRRERRRHAAALLRDLRDPELRRLAGTEGARQPFFSPDGQWLAFFADRKLVKVSIGGGPVLDLTDVGGNFRGATWTSDGTIVIAPTQTAGLMRVPDRGGAQTPLTTLDKAHGEYLAPLARRAPRRPMGALHRRPRGRDLRRGQDRSGLARERRAARRAHRRRLRPLHADGRLLFVRGGQPLLGRLRSRPAGGPRHAGGRCSTRSATTGATAAATWRSRARRARSSTRRAKRSHTSTTCAWVDHDGRAAARAVDTPRRFRDLERAPDGKRIAVAVGTPPTRICGRSTRTRPCRSCHVRAVAVSPDVDAGRQGITVGARKGSAWRLLTLPADGNAAPKIIYEAAYRMYPSAWSPDGRYLLFQQRRPQTGWDLYLLHLDAAGNPIGPPQAFAATPFHEANASISRKGGWVAYESGRGSPVRRGRARRIPGRRSSTRVHGRRSLADVGFRGQPRLLADRRRSVPVGCHASGKRPADRRRSPARVGERGRRRFIPAHRHQRRGCALRHSTAGTRFLMLESAADASRPTLSQPLIVLGPGARLVRHRVDDDVDADHVGLGREGFEVPLAVASRSQPSPTSVL